MTILEASIFTKQVQQYLTDNEYRQLQYDLIACPDVGPIIPGSSGRRKMCWLMIGRGKRGGLCLIYYWMKSSDHLRMLYIYPKSKQENLTPAQLRALKQVIDEVYP